MIIDADAHVEESEAMFDRIDKEFRPRRPLPVRLDTDTVYGKYNAVWLIDGETYPKLAAEAARSSAPRRSWKPLRSSARASARRN
jgi:hypothetical protein